ncbi:MAG: SAM-dependent methyltransferase [Crocosphaera sp.]
MSDIKDFVPFTSLVIAAERAIETERENALFKDPYARKLAGEEAFLALNPKKNIITKQEGRPYIPVRTRFFDDFLINSVSECKQVIILGAGMDTRAFRLNIPKDTHIYEIDQAEVLDYKNTILKDICTKNNLHSIKADLRLPWIHLLLESGYCQEQPSVWLLEGLLYYLTETEVEQLLQIISNITAKNSYLIADLVNRKALEGNEKIRKHWRSGFDEPEILFANHGWTASVVQPGDENAHFGRYINKLPPRHIPNVKRVFFVTAKNPQ